MKHFTDAQFEKYRFFIYEKFGINLNSEKKEMLQTRLHKLMSKHGMDSYDQYYNLILLGRKQDELIEFANAITINKTDFFRENNHFDFIKGKIDLVMQKNANIKRTNEIRVWSAGSSTGQEAYTLAMVLKECLPQGMNIKILATDISSKVLSIAQNGIYPSSIKSEVQPYYLGKYFRRIGGDFAIKQEIRELVTFRLFNLMDAFPFKQKFDFIFCRNVMIYFDADVQQRLLDKFYKALSPAGLLFIGHSESLTNKKHQFQYIQPTIYMK